MTSITNYLGVTVPEEEIAFLNKKARLITIKKADFFARPDTVCHSIGFVETGLMRSYVTIDDKEYNIEFYAENQFVSAFTSFLTRRPSEWHIQALETSELLIISYDLLEQLYQRHPAWIAFGKHIFELQTVKKCQREKSLIRDNADLRYQQFQTEYHNVEQRLSLFQIASYVGIEPETLSRLRKKQVLDLRQGTTR